MKNVKWFIEATREERIEEVRSYPLGTVITVRTGDNICKYTRNGKSDLGAYDKTDANDRFLWANCTVGSVAWDLKDADEITVTLPDEKTKLTFELYDAEIGTVIEVDGARYEKTVPAKEAIYATANAYAGWDKLVNENGEWKYDTYNVGHSNAWMADVILDGKKVEYISETQAKIVKALVKGGFDRATAANMVEKYYDVAVRIYGKGTVKELAKDIRELWAA